MWNSTCQSGDILDDFFLSPGPGSSGAKCHHLHLIDPLMATIASQSTWLNMNPRRVMAYPLTRKSSAPIGSNGPAWCIASGQRLIEWCCWLCLLHQRHKTFADHSRLIQEILDMSYHWMIFMDLWSIRFYKFFKRFYKILYDSLRSIRSYKYVIVFLTKNRNVWTPLAGMRRWRLQPWGQLQLKLFLRHKAIWGFP